MSSFVFGDFEKPTNSSTAAFKLTSYICNYVLYATVKHSYIRILDIVLLVPNALFMIFLFYGLTKAQMKFSLVHCPIVKTVFTLMVENQRTREIPSRERTAQLRVFAVCITGVVRCFASMLLTTSNLEKNNDDLVIKILWLILRCLLLGVEMCVIIFALIAGKVDCNYGVRNVLLISSVCVIIFTSIQATLEFTVKTSGIYGGRYDFFKHGGMIFWFTSSTIFALVYLTVLILPFTPLKWYHIFPIKKTFYWYCGILSVLNILQSIGSGLLVFLKERTGICLVDVASISYFALFGPFVYLIFLSDFLSSKTSHILSSERPSFSYQHIPDNFMPTEEINDDGGDGDDSDSYAHYGSIS